MQKVLNRYTIGASKTNLLIEVICSAFIFLFAYTAISKILEFDTFKSVLSRSPLIGQMNSWVAWMLPGIELFICIFLFIPSLRRIGLYFSLAIMSVFTLYILYMILFSSHLPCSCGGVISKMSWNQHLAFNIILTGLAIYGTVLERRLMRKTKGQNQNIALA